MVFRASLVSCLLVCGPRTLLNDTSLTKGSLFNPDQANLGGRLGFIFGGLSLLCLMYLWFYQPETAGRTYEELDEMFMKNVPAR